ncbi:MAG: 50S ribosomal protein L11, partial [Candidatus ainarchaeum sp.]|nr:50S ribosomal protein L11 [Candidatus ainarchaeum sp.]
MGDIKVMVTGGKATAGPPIGPALAPLGVNIGAVVAKINEKTADLDGMQVPVTISINADKSFDIQVGLPPTSALIC